MVDALIGLPVAFLMLRLAGRGPLPARVPLTNCKRITQ